jgi:hypothetical protein
MLGLTLRSDGSAVDAAIEALVEELNKLMATGSANRDGVHRRQEGNPYQNRHRKPKQHSRAESAEHKRDERTQAAANRLVACIVAAGRVAGFDVAGSDEG